jgi:hypothetical protein
VRRRWIVAMTGRLSMVVKWRGPRWRRKADGGQAQDPSRENATEGSRRVRTAGLRMNRFV